MSRSRNWCFTINNYTDEDRDRILANRDEFVWLIYQPEIGANGTPHLQGAVVFANPRAMGGVKRLLSPRAHLEVMRGTPAESAAYCSKDDTRDTGASFGVFEHGDMPAGPGQGARTDLAAIGQRLVEGASLAAIAQAYPSDFIRYHAGFRALQSQVVTVRKWKTRVWWYYGTTGTGKSHAARLQFEDAYWKNPTHTWWDGYDPGTESVIIDDYRCNFCHFSELLRLFDEYPLQLQVKGGTVQFRARDIVITAPHRPEVMWQGRTAEDLGQLMRRIEVIRLFGEEPVVAPRVAGFEPL